MPNVSMKGILHEPVIECMGVIVQFVEDFNDKRRILIWEERLGGLPFNCPLLLHLLLFSHQKSETTLELVWWQLL